MMTPRQPVAIMDRRMATAIPSQPLPMIPVSRDRMAKPMKAPTMKMSPWAKLSSLMMP